MSAPQIESLTSRVLAVPSAVADALIVQIPALAKYDLGPCSFPHLMKVIALLGDDDWAGGEDR
jgi:hypothetical protein